MRCVKFYATDATQLRALRICCVGLNDSSIYKVNES